MIVTPRREFVRQTVAYFGGPGSQTAKYDLTDEVYEWLDQRETNYEVYHGPSLFVTFTDSDAAMEFKIRWG